MINVTIPWSNYKCPQVHFHLNICWKAQPQPFHSTLKWKELFQKATAQICCRVIYH